MQPTNVLFIMSDQQQGRALSCVGHDFVRTPNLDKLAARGTRFANAYTNSAICVPARGVIATGQHVFKTQYWCNAHPYDGRVKSWHHLLGENGRPVTSIGKLHFRDESDPTGFANQLIPMHVVEGRGDLRSCIKRPMSPPMQSSRTVTHIGRGTSPYTDYDRDIATVAVRGCKSTTALPRHFPCLCRLFVRTRPISRPRNSMTSILKRACPFRSCRRQMHQRIHGFRRCSAIETTTTSSPMNRVV